MSKKQRFLKFGAALLLLAAAGIAAWYLVRDRIGTPPAPEVTIGRAQYAVGERVTATVRNVSRSVIDVEDSFTVERQAADGRWEKVACGGKATPCRTGCSVGADFAPLVFGEGRDLAWDGLGEQCAGTALTGTGEPTPGTYRLTVGYLPEGARPDLIEIPFAAASFTLTASGEGNGNANTNAPGKAGPGSVGNTNNTNTTDLVPDASCRTDADCETNGCNGELCVPKGSDVSSACVALKEFACLKETHCGCVSGTCAWAETDAYRACLKTLGAP